LGATQSPIVFNKRKELLNQMGKPLDDLEKQIGTEALKERLDQAVLLAI
jgi:hypothetical protein